MTTEFIPFTMRDSACDHHQRTFRTDIQRISTGHLRFAPVDMLRATDTQALFRVAVPTGAHTANDASRARFLEDRLASENIHLDLSVSI